MSAWAHVCGCAGARPGAQQLPPATERWPVTEPARLACRSPCQLQSLCWRLRACAGDAVQVLAVMAEKAQGAASRWAPYLALLPDDMTHMPFYWTDGELVSGAGRCCCGPAGAWFGAAKGVGRDGGWDCTRARRLRPHNGRACPADPCCPPPSFAPPPNPQEELRGTAAFDKMAGKVVSPGDAPTRVRGESHPRRHCHASPHAPAALATPAPTLEELPARGHRRAELVATRCRPL